MKSGLLLLFFFSCLLNESLIIYIFLRNRFEITDLEACLTAHISQSRSVLSCPLNNTHTVCIMNNNAGACLLVITVTFKNQNECTPLAEESYFPSTKALTQSR